MFRFTAVTNAAPGGAMFRNYLVTALRNLKRNRRYAAISIAGLAVAFAAAILIGVFVRDDLTTDRFIPGHADVYRLSINLVAPGLVVVWLVVVWSVFFVFLLVVFLLVL